MKQLFAALLFVLMSGALFTACSKKQIQGPKGDPGTPGNGGNTNINSSEVFLVASSQWQPSNADSSLWQCTVSSTLITKDVVSKGSVKLYNQGGSAWYELPFIDEDLYTQFGYAEGTIKLIRSDVHGEKIPGPADAYYRLVVLSQSARVLPPGLATDATATIKTVINN